MFDPNISNRFSFELNRCPAEPMGSCCRGGKIKDRVTILDGANPLVSIAAKRISEGEYQTKRAELLALDHLSIFKIEIPCSLVTEDNKADYFLMNIRSCIKRLGITKEKLFESAQSGTLRKLIRNTCGLNFFKTVSNNFPHISFEDCMQVSSYVIRNRIKLQSRADNSIRGGVYKRASEIRPRGIQFNNNGSVFVHLNKKRLGDVDIGRGGLKRVRLAIDYDSGQIICVARALKGKAHLGKNRDLNREMSFSRSLKGAKNIANVFQVITVSGKKTKAFFIQPFYNRGNLIDALKSDGELTEKDRISLIWDIVLGVADLEKAGIIHRDLKPGNILLHRDERGIHAFIADFGCACYIDEPEKFKNNCGTRPFFSPEYLAAALCQNEETQYRLLRIAHSHKRDAWALGCIVSRILGNMEVPKQTVQLLSPLKSIQDDPLSHLKYDLLQINPQDRLSATMAVEKYQRYFEELVAS